MFPLTAQRRRLVCRSLFLLLAVAPMLWVCSWAVAWNLPSHARGIRHSLSGFVGRDVEFSAVVHPRPGVTRLIGVKLHNPETRDVILTAGVLEADYGDRQLTVDVDDVRCLPGGLPELVDLLADQLGGRWEAATGSESIDRVHVRPSQWTVATDDEAEQTLDNVELDLHWRNGAPQTRLRFELPDHDGDSAAENDVITVNWTRNRNITPPTTGLVLDTGNVALPCSLLRSVQPDFIVLGSHATFRGTANVQCCADGCSGSIEGDLTGVLLDRLVSDGSEYVLSGQADIVGARIELDAGRIVAAGGTLTTSGGRVSQALLAALAKCDGMIVHLPNGDASTIHRYGQLACTLMFATDGLSLTAPNGDGVIMTAEDGSPLIRESSTNVEPVALAAALLPKSGVMIPATRQSAAVMRWLPLTAHSGDEPDAHRIATPRAHLKSVRRQ